MIKQILLTALAIVLPLTAFAGEPSVQPSQLQFFQDVTDELTLSDRGKTALETLLQDIRVYEEEQSMQVILPEYQSALREAVAIHLRQTSIPQFIESLSLSQATFLRERFSSPPSLKSWIPNFGFEAAFFQRLQERITKLTRIRNNLFDVRIDWVQEADHLLETGAQLLGLADHVTEEHALHREIVIERTQRLLDQVHDAICMVRENPPDADFLYSVDSTVTTPLLDQKASLQQLPNPSRIATQLSRRIRRDSNQPTDPDRPINPRLGNDARSIGIRLQTKPYSEVANAKNLPGTEPALFRLSHNDNMEKDWKSSLQLEPIHELYTFGGMRYRHEMIFGHGIIAHHNGSTISLTFIAKLRSVQLHGGSYMIWLASDLGPVHVRMQRQGSQFFHLSPARADLLMLKFDNLVLQ